MRTEAPRALLAIAAAALLTIFALSGCSVIRQAERSPDQAVQSTLEIWYITCENPENNRPGERDSIKAELRTQLKK